MRTFICDFVDGWQCKVEAEDTRPDPDVATPRMVEEWNRKPKYEHFRLFILWKCGVMELLATLWDTPIIHEFRTPLNDGELWQFLPGKKGRFIRYL